MKRKFYTFCLLACAAVLIPACSKDDNSNNNNNNNNGPVINIRLVAGSTYTYTRTDLDSANNKIAGTSRDYTVQIRAGSTFIGAYNDWYYRYATDQQNNTKDTTYIRINTGSSNGVSFTKEVMLYGFSARIAKDFADLIHNNFGAPYPSIAGPQWEAIVKYHDDNGKGYDVGTQWTIGNVNGTEMSFLINGNSVTATLFITGKLEAKEEIITVNSKQIKTWKSSVTVDAKVLGSTLASIKTYLWFSDDPDAQIQIKKESTKITIPFVGAFNVPGEMQELKTYLQ